MQNREFCPCYEGRQSEKPHVRTVAGTRAHGVVETGEDDSRLGDEDALAAAGCVDFAEQRRQLMVEEAARVREAGGHTDPQFDPGYRVLELQETYLPVDDIVFPDCKATTAGYMDKVLVNYNATRAEGFDWKFGYWPVEDPANNLQVIAYTLGIFKKFPTVQAVKFWVLQPHLDVTKSADFTRDRIPGLYLRIQVVVARARAARNDFSMANPAVPVCNFCANLGRCHRVAEFACKVGAKFHPLEIPADITPSTVQDPTQTALGLRLCAVLKVWCDAFRRQVTERILRGEAPLPPGQKIQEMKKREIVDLAKLKSVALKYLTAAEYESTLETTFGAVEDLISEKAPRGAKKQTVEEFQAELLKTGAVAYGEPFSFLRAIPVKS